MFHFWLFIVCVNVKDSIKTVFSRPDPSKESQSLLKSLIFVFAAVGINSRVGSWSVSAHRSMKPIRKQRASDFEGV